MKTSPDYPPLARQTRIEGVVSIDAVLDERGNVIQMNVVSGPPVLIKAALEAVQQWKYEPSYLNDEPVSVELIIKVNFQLNR